MTDTRNCLHIFRDISTLNRFVQILIIQIEMETPKCPKIPNPSADWKLNPSVECRIILNKLKIKTPEYETMEFCRMLTNRSVGSVPTQPRVTMFECDICSSMYSSPSMLIRHRNTHWNPLTTRSKIPDKSRISISPSFDMSSVTRTNEGVSSVQCENHPQQPVPVPVKNLEWNCLKQEEPTSSQSELEISNPNPLGILQHMNHLSTIENNVKQECDDFECEEDLSDPLLLQDIQVPSFVKSECTEISTESEQKTVFMTHEKSSNDTPAGSESFIVQPDLRHKITHTNTTAQKTLKCDKCGKCFSLLQHLTQHKIVHTGERPLECDVCGKCFARKYLLVQHRLTHPVEKSFGCDECGRHFVFKNSLAVHKLTHTGDKPKPELTRHKLVHTGEKRQECNECGKCFVSKSALRIHKIIHTGERPYKCDVCGKSFRQSSSLKPHALTHIGEKSFQCDVCGQRFVGHYDYELTKHKIMHILESTNTTLVNNLKEERESEEEGCQEDPLLIPELP